MEKLIEALDLYEDLQDLAMLGLTEEEMIGYIDFFYEPEECNEQN